MHYLDVHAPSGVHPVHMRRGLCDYAPLHCTRLGVSCLLINGDPAVESPQLAPTVLTLSPI